MHGYSSSEESDDPRRPKSPPASNNNNDNKKKTKKPKPPPQASINHIWKTFQKRKFNKAVSVLPFDPVAPSAGSDRPNELFGAGYERAADECRRKVKKIIQECRRVNTRYRDPGWDLVSAIAVKPRDGDPLTVIAGLGPQVGEGQLPEQPRQHKVEHQQE